MARFTSKPNDLAISSIFLDIMLRFNVFAYIFLNQRMSNSSLVLVSEMQITDSKNVHDLDTIQQKILFNNIVSVHGKLLLEKSTNTATPSYFLD